MTTFDHILKAKGTSVHTVSADMSLAEAAQTLDRHRIGAVVATYNEGELAGVLSERDIVRQTARHGAAALEMRVSDAMTRDLVIAKRSDTIEAGLAKMTDRRIRHLPVVDDSGLVGIISIGDLVKQKISETEAEADAMRNYIASG